MRVEISVLALSNCQFEHREALNDNKVMRMPTNTNLQRKDQISCPLLKENQVRNLRLRKCLKCDGKDKW